MFLFCKIHPKTQMYTLHYSTRRVKRSQSVLRRNQKFIHNTINFLYCPKCDKVYKIKLTVKQTKEKITKWQQMLGATRRRKLEQIKIDVQDKKKWLEGKYKRRTGRPYSPKPLPIKIKRLRDGWYFSKVSTKFHYIKNNRFYCHPNHKIDLDLIPVKQPKKFKGKMCRTCGRKKGVYSYEESPTWNKHYKKKLDYDRKRYKKKKRGRNT